MQNDTQTGLLRLENIVCSCPSFQILQAIRIVVSVFKDPFKCWYCSTLVLNNNVSSRLSHLLCCVCAFFFFLFLLFFLSFDCFILVHGIAWHFNVFIWNDVNARPQISSPNFYEIDGFLSFRLRFNPFLPYDAYL